MGHQKMRKILLGWLLEVWKKQGPTLSEMEIPKFSREMVKKKQKLANVGVLECIHCVRPVMTEGQARGLSPQKVAEKVNRA